MAANTTFTTPKGTELRDCTPDYWREQGGIHFSLRLPATGVEVSCLRDDQYADWNVFDLAGDHKILPHATTLDQVLDHMANLLRAGLLADLAGLS
jgi:hypothetical protein